MIVKKCSIYKANPYSVIGCEQGKSRPVLIISDNEINELLNSVNVIPITTLKPSRQIYPNEVLISNQESKLPNESIILCHQIRTINKQRLGILYGEINETTIQNTVYDSLFFQLGIDREVNK